MKKTFALHPLLHLVLLFALAGIFCRCAGCAAHAGEVTISDQTIPGLSSLTNLVPTKADLLTRFDGSVALGYNTATHSGVQVLAVDASLAPSLNLGAVVIHDHYGWSGGAFSFNLTGQLGPITGVAGAGPGYDWQLKKPMAYLFIGAGWPIHAGKFTITPSVIVANESTRPGTTLLGAFTINF